MDERFRESWFNRDHVVLGRRLHPFCLYDALILSEFQSPFIADQKDKPTVFTLEDLQTAVLVCSSAPEVFLNARLIRSRWDALRMWWFGVKSHRVCPTQAAFRHQGKLFGAYLRDFSSPPEFWEDEDGTGVARLPWILSNAVHLLRTTHMTREEIWRLPLGQVFWYSATIAIQMGTTKAELMTPEEEAAMAELGYGE